MATKENLSAKETVKEILTQRLAKTPEYSGLSKLADANLKSIKEKVNSIFKEYTPVFGSQAVQEVITPVIIDVGKNIILDYNKKLKSLNRVRENYIKKAERLDKLEEETERDERAQEIEDIFHFIYYKVFEGSN